MSEPLVRLSGARLGYGLTTILQGVDLEVQPGDFWGIVGPNGCGKTTLLRAILGIIPALDGECDVRGRLGYSPQRSVLDPIYPFTAAEVVGMGLLGESGLTRTAKGSRVDEALTACGMQAQAETPFRDLSGGQKQRVLVARALVSQPEVLVLDEPTNDLDLRGETEVMGLLRELNRGGRTILMVTHMLHLVARYAGRVALINAGRLRAGEGLELLSPENLAELYGLDVAVGEFSGERVIVPVTPEEATET